MRTHSNATTRARLAIRTVAVLVATTTTLGGLVILGGPAGAKTPSSIAPYVAQIQHYNDEIASDIGHPLGIQIKVVRNATQEGGANTLAAATVLDASGDQVGAPATCTIGLDPLLFHRGGTAEVNLTFAHEVFHCYEATDYPTLSAFNRAPAWLLEGEAEWVGATLVPSTDDFWTAYLTKPGQPLFDRAYDAIGFYSLMSETGDDTWHLLDPMLKAGSNAAAFAVASNPTLLLDWASSLARQPSLGAGWDATGPGINDAIYTPTTSVVRPGTKLTAKVAPYTNALIKFNPSAAVVAISTGTIDSRLHDATGDTIDAPTNTYCVHECTSCPEMRSLPQLTAGTAWLSVTGGPDGTLYTVLGKNAQCNASCMVGNWTVTNLDFTTEGRTFSGGAGTTVDIDPDGSVTADFTPGTPVGALKFSGIITSTYGLPDPMETSGSFPVSDYDTSAATVSIAGRSQQVSNSAVSSGTFACTGTTGLTLNFLAGGNGFDYTMVRAS